MNEPTLAGLCQSYVKQIKRKRRVAKKIARKIRKAPRCPKCTGANPRALLLDGGYASYCVECRRKVSAARYRRKKQ